MENKQYQPRWEVDFSNPNADNITTGTTTGKLMIATKRQTAVEWLIKEFNLENFVATCNFAKEKEKQQIMNAYVKGQSDCEMFTMESEAEQYYKDTYEPNRKP